MTTALKWTLIVLFLFDVFFILFGVVFPYLISTDQLSVIVILLWLSSIIALIIMMCIFLFKQLHGKKRKRKNDESIG